MVLNLKLRARVLAYVQTEAHWKNLVTLLRWNSFPGPNRWEKPECFTILPLPIRDGPFC
jgi:hypothetical protein